MTPNEYAEAWKRYVYVHKGEGTEAKSLLVTLGIAWAAFSYTQQSRPEKVAEFYKEIPWEWSDAEYAAIKAIQRDQDSR